MLSPFSLPSRGDTARSIGAEADEMEARRKAPRPSEAAVTVEDRLKEIAAQTQIPRNVLLAIAEASGAQDGKAVISAAANAGIRLSRAVRGGQSLRDAINSVTGDEMLGDAIIRRAEMWANDLDPAGDPENAARPQDYNALRDVPAQALADFGNFVGRGAAQVGAAFDRAVVRPAAEVLINRPARALGAPADFDAAPALNVGTAVGQVADKTVGALGRAIDRHVVSRAAKETKTFTPESDLFRPSTWQLSDEASIAGFLQAGASVLGSMLPVIAAGIVSGGAGAAGMGGMIGFGGAADDVSSVLDQMASEITQDGRSTRLMDESSVYRGLRERGVGHADALAQTKAQAADIAGTLASVPAAIGGALTQRIMKMPAAMAGKVPTRAGRALATGVVSGTEEGAQEVIEGVAARAGGNIGGGLDQSLTEGSLGDAVLGFGAGAVPGAVAGAMSRNPRERQIDDALGDRADAGPAEPLALPAPGNGGTIFGEGRPGVPPGTIEVPPGTLPRAQGQAQPAQFRPPAAPPAPAGPLSTATARAPAPILPDGMAGSSTVFHVEIDGIPTPIEARILSETGMGVEMRDEVTGETFTVPRSEFESGAVRLSRLPDPIPEVKADAPRSPSPADQTPAAPSQPDQAPVAPPAVGQPAAPAVDAPPAAPAPLAPAPAADAAGGLTGQIVPQDGGIGGNVSPEVTPAPGAETKPAGNIPKDRLKQPGHDQIMRRDYPPPDAFGRLERLTTGTARLTAPFPEIRVDTPAKATNSVKRINEWWLKEAIAEMDAKGMGDGMAKRMLQSALETGNISPSDLDLAKDALGDLIRGEAKLTPQQRAENAERAAKAEIAAKVKERAEEKAKAEAQQAAIAEMEGREPTPEDQAAIDAVMADLDAELSDLMTAPEVTEDAPAEDQAARDRRKTWRSKEFKALLAPRIRGNKDRAGVHEESPVAADYVQGYRDAKDGKPMDMSRIGGAPGAIEPYLEAYYAVRMGTEFAPEIRGSTAQSYIAAIAAEDAAKPEEPADGPKQGESSLPGGVSDGEARAEGQREAKRTVIAAKRRADYVKDSAASARFGIDMRKPISAKLMAEAQAFLAANPGPDAEAGSNADQKGQEPVAEGEIPIPPGALTEADQEAAPSDEPAFMGAIRDRLRARISVTLPRAGRIDSLVDLDSRVRWESGLGLLYIPPRGRSELFTPAEIAKMEADFPAVAAPPEAENMGDDGIPLPDVPAPDMAEHWDEGTPAQKGAFAILAKQDPEDFKRKRWAELTDAQKRAILTAALDSQSGRPTEITRMYQAALDALPADVADVADVAPPEDIGKRWNKLKGPSKLLIVKAAGLDEAARDKSWHEMTPPEQRAIGAVLAANDAGGKIEDFGKGKIFGSRKDMRAEVLDAMEGEISERQIRAQPLSKTWPEPNWQAMVESGVPQDQVAAVAILRNNIPRKPSRNYEVRAWADRVRDNMDSAKAILKGETTPKDAFKTSDKWDERRRYAALMEVMEGITPAEIADFSRVTVATEGATIRGPRDEKGFSTWLPAVSVEMPWQVRKRGGFMRGKTFDKTTEDLDGVIRQHIRLQWLARREHMASRRDDDGKREKKVRLEVDQKAVAGPDGRTVLVWVINADFGNGPYEIHGEFPTKDEAAAYLEENRDDLTTQAREDRSMRGSEWKDPDEVQPRAGGTAWRAGNVTPQMFMDTFGLTDAEGFAAQFGKSTPQKERQERLNETYDALMDLSAVLGLPPKALFLNGKLKLSFGARGKGGYHAAAAHFEMAQKVINLTRMNGAGTLSHEWFHALDNFIAGLISEETKRTGWPGFQRLDYASRGSRKSIIRERPFSDVRQDFATATDVKIEDGRDGVGIDRKVIRLAEAAYGVRRAVRSWPNAWYARAIDMDKSWGGDPYWTQTIELSARLFERTVYDRLGERGIQNDFLVGINAYGGAYPSPREARMIKADAAMAELIEALADYIGTEGAFTADLPPIDLTYGYRGPKLGQSWEGPNGVTRRIINVIEPTRPGRERQFEVDEGEGGESIVLSESGVEALFDADAKLTDPQTLERMGARQAAQDAAAAKKQAEQDARDARIASARARIEMVYAGNDTARERMLDRLDGYHNTPTGLNGVPDRNQVLAALHLYDQGWRVRVRPGTKRTLDMVGPPPMLMRYGSGTGISNDVLSFITDLTNADEEAARRLKEESDARPGNDSVEGGQESAQDGDPEQEAAQDVPPLAESGGQDGGAAPAGSDAGAEQRVPDAVPPGEQPADLTSDQAFDQAFDDLFNPEPAPASAPQGGRVEDAWALFDDADRRMAMIGAGIKEGTAARNTGKEWEELPQAIRDALTAEWAKAPADVQESLSGQAGANAPVTPPPSGPRTAGEAASSAASNIAGGTGDVLDGLFNLFGGKNSLNSGLGFDRDRYEQAKPMFVEAARKFGAAGQDIIDVMKAVMRSMIERFGQQAAAPVVQNMRPYITQFAEDVRDGIINPWEASETENDGGADQGSDQGRPSPNDELDGSPDRGDGEGSDPAGDGGNRGPDGDGTEPDGGVGGSGGPVSGPLKGENPGNYVLTDADMIGTGTPGQRIRGNIEAIRIVKALEAEHRYPTREEQAKLAKFVGWGGLRPVLDPNNAGKSDQNGRAQAELRELLTKEEYNAAFDSTANAHYTAPGIVRAMWGAMEHFGFKGGRALEPTMGVGNFLGFQPEGMAASTEWHGAELDPMTGKIAAALYPDAAVMHSTGFQDAPFGQGVFDIAIGNPPFGSDTIRRGRDKSLAGMKVHNYIIAKTGQHLRPGGIMAMVVTHRFLDTSNPEARDRLAKDFRFMGAIRLPNDAFAENANTEVTTDIVFLQKLKPGEDPGSNAWLDTNGSLPDGIRVNRYFAENPQNILGRSALDGTMYGGRGGEYTVHSDGRDLTQAIRDVLTAGTLSGFKDALGTREEALEAAVMEILPSSIPEGGMILDANGNPLIREGEKLVPVTAQSLWKAGAEDYQAAVTGLEGLRDAAKSGLSIIPSNVWQKYEDATRFLYSKKDGATRLSLSGNTDPLLADIADAGPGTAEKRFVWGKKHKDALANATKMLEGRRLGEKDLTRLKGLLGLRRDTMALIAAERSDASTAADLRKLRKALNATYDAFVKANGLVNDPANRAVLRGDIGVESGLEASYDKPKGNARTGGTAQKATIFTERVFFPYKGATKADSAEDGLLISIMERGVVDIPFIAALTGQDAKSIIETLTSGTEPRIFFNPETSGYEDAEAYLSGNVKRKLAVARSEGLTANIRALEANQPAPMVKEQITPNIRSMWIPTEVFEAFLSHMGVSSPKVAIYQDAGRFAVGGSVANLSDYGAQFRHDAKDVLDIFRAATSGKPMKVEVRDPTTRRMETDEAATKEVNALAERMATEFEKWAYLNTDRTQTIVDAYNEKMNTHVERKFDGVKYLRPVGLNPLMLPGGGEPLRNTQLNGAWRMIVSPSSMMHHVVGAGKTRTAIVGIMERRRMGLSKKPLIVVPNHLVGQWAADFQLAYPGARVLAAGKEDFTEANRRRMFSRIGTGDWDAIIIGHSQLTRLENDPADAERIIEEQLDLMRETLAEARKNNESGRTLTQISNMVKKYEERLRTLRESAAKRTDSIGMNFREMGIDYLVVDEAHEFKNLEYQSGGERLVGMNSPTGSQRAFDLYIKTRRLLDGNAQGEGNGVSFLTGTPISNSLVEAYTMMKFLAPQSLKDRGVMHFDAWSGAYVQAATKFEYNATNRIVPRRVMSHLVNLRTLSQLYREFADVILNDKLREIYAEQIREENARTANKRAAEGIPAKPERFPTPRVAGGGRQLDSAPATPAQMLYTDFLASRMQGMRGQNPREYQAIDNALWVLSDARKAAIDIRNVDPDDMERHPSSKSARAAARIYDKWVATGNSLGAQLVFSDLSTPKKQARNAVVRILAEAYVKADAAKPEKQRLKTKAARERAEALADAKANMALEWTKALEAVDAVINDPATKDEVAESLSEWIEANMTEAAAAMATFDSGFSVYDDLKAALIEKGIPAEEITFIHDHDTDAAKNKLFADVKAGRIRVLIGSTQKMGAGTNVQERLVALHHMDAPWRPSDVEQREGRIIRAKNKLYEADPEGFEVDIWAYSTEGTSDVVLWQVLERKARAIEQFLSGALDRVEEDNDDSDKYADFMAASTGNPVFKWKLEAERDLLMAEAEVSGLLSTREDAKSFLRTLSDRIASAEADIAMLDLVPLKAASITINGRKIEADPADLAPALEAYREKFMAAREEHEKAREAWEAAETERRNKAKEGEKIARTPAPKFDMPAPTIYVPEVQAASSYARLVKAVLEASRAGRPEQEFRIDFDGGRHAFLTVTRSPSNLDENKSDYDLRLRLRTERDIENGSRGTNLILEGARVTDPLASGTLERNMKPGTIRGFLEYRAESGAERIKALREREPVAREQVNLSVDESKVTDLKAKVAYYTGAVAVAEAEREFQQRDKPVNPFIIKDQAKHPERVYSMQSGGLVDEQVDFVIAKGAKGAGSYIGTGIGAAPEIAPGINSSMVFFEAVAEGGKKALFRAIRTADFDPARYRDVRADGDVTSSGGDPKKGGWTVIEVMFEPERPVAAERRGQNRNLFGGPVDKMTPPDRLKWEAQIAAEMKRIGIPPGKVSARLVDFVKGFGADRGTLGMFTYYRRGNKRGEIQVSGRWGDTEMMMTLRHEIIHALRSDVVWDNEYGLFTKAEWTALVRAARSDVVIRRWVAKNYANDPAEIQTEEMVAEYFARWARDQDILREGSFLAKAMVKLRDMFRAISRLIAYGPMNGQMTGEQVMRDILSGGIGPRGNPPPPSPRRVAPNAQTAAAAAARAAGLISEAEAERGMASMEPVARYRLADGTDLEAETGKGIRVMGGTMKESLGRRVRSAITRAMSGDYSLLSLVPGRALFDELASKIVAAQSYMKSKNAMEVDRNNWITRTQQQADKWRAAAVGNPEANKTAMRIMHESTIFQVDPTKPFKSLITPSQVKLVQELGIDPARAADKDHREAIAAWERDAERKAKHASLKAELEALPAAFQTLYSTIRDEYSAMQKDYDDALKANIDKVAEITARRSARRLEKKIREIEGDGSMTPIEKAEAIEKAEGAHEKAVQRAKEGAKGRSAGLRKLFESNRISGPYFPLSRFGDFFVTERDGEGNVVRFSRFESEADQMAAVKAAKAAGHSVEHGVLSERNSARGMVDPTFVAEVETLLAGADVSKDIMDAVWQKWLETLPDISVRKNKIHRKGREGYTDDAFRAYTNQMFHASYQLARLKHGLDMQDALDEAELEAARSSDPNRNGLIVREMAKRHLHTMNPMGKPWTSYITSATFIWYLGLTPAAAMINLSQTTVMGIPILSTISKSGAAKAMAEAAAEVAQASRDFFTAKGLKIENNPKLTDNERLAMHRAYELGILEKTQAHDLAGMSEEGLRYNPIMFKAMGYVSWGFHHAERLNREVTFMAAYRMATKAGQDHEAAIETASKATYKAHFSYQASDRPRAMQGDMARVLLTFRQHSVNMIFRLFRDLHQATKGESPEIRREARRQLLGITGMMMLHAGVSGTWLFGITMMIAGMFFGGGADEAEAEFKSAIVDLFGTTIGGTIWYGALNQMTGLDISGRVGMPDLWFRSEGRDMEGEDAYNAMVQQMIGAAPGIIESFYRGTEMMADGNWYRGVETMLPKALRDVMRAARFTTEGAQTMRGDTLVEDVGALDAARQLLGFTPAKISERYEINNYLKNREGQIIQRRQRIHGDIAKALMAGKPIPADVVERMTAFNRDFPEYPITARTIKQSVRSRMMASERNEFGIQLNPRLNERLRAEAPPVTN